MKFRYALCSMHNGCDLIVLSRRILFHYTFLDILRDGSNLKSAVESFDRLHIVMYYTLDRRGL